MASLSLRRETGTTSREWEVSKKHVGLYSGGKLAMFSPGGRDVLACLYGEDVSFVDMATGQVIATLQGTDNEANNIEGAELAREVITTFCVNQRKSEVVTASRNMMIRHWSVNFEEESTNNGKTEEGGHPMRCIRTLKGHTEPILCMDYDPSGVFVATGSADRTARVWDMRGGFATHNFRGHGGIVSLVKFHPDPKKLLLITSCDDCATRIWSMYDKSCVATLGNHMSAVTSVAFSIDGNTMVTGSRDKVINFWEMRRHTLMKTLPVYEEVEGLCIVHGDGEQQQQGTVGEGAEEEEGVEETRHKKKSKKSKKDMASTNATSAKKQPTAVEDASGTLIVIGSKGIARSWKFQAKDHLELAEYSRKGGKDDLLLCTESAQQLSANSTPSPYTSLIHVHGRSVTIPGREPSLLDNEMIVCATADHNINCIDPYSLKTYRKIVGYFDEVNTIKYVQDGSNNKLAVATNSDQLKILKINDFSCEVLEGHQGTIITLDVCSTGRFVVTGSKDRTARVWDIVSNQCVMVCVGHTQAVSAVGLSRRPKPYEVGDSFFFTGSGDKTLKKWKLDVTDKQFVDMVASSSSVAPLQPHAMGNIRAHEKDINHLCVSPNDSVVVSSSQVKQS
jgi:U3 small nucleolar RNA-associated protein 13